MRSLRIFHMVLACTALLCSAQAQNAWNNLLSKHVDKGYVDYASIKADPDLGKAQSYFETTDYTSMDSLSRMAHLINAYNFFVISGICESYPVSSPMDITGFFDSKKHTLGGEKITLNTLENDVLRKAYFDPRLHFALVCGALGCPRLASQPFTDANIESLLQKRALAALNAEWFVYQKNDQKKVYLSEIFKWYSEDFGGNNKSAVAYINTIRKTPLNGDYGVVIYPYDWTLNDKANRKPASGTDGSPRGELPKDGGGADEFSLQTYNAGSLLGRGQMDLTMFNSMYTENRQNWREEDVSGYRSTFASTLLQWTVGVGNSKRLSAGVDLTFRANGGTSVDSSFSAIDRAFGFRNTDSTRAGLTSVGIRAKVQPFKHFKDFTLQSTVTVPTVVAPEGRGGSEGVEPLAWAEWNRIVWWNQFFYVKSFSDFQLFTELDLLFRFGTNADQMVHMDLPVSVFLSYFPTPKTTVYVMTQHVERFVDVPSDEERTDWVLPAYYTASGLGFKYQLSKKLNTELLYTNFWRAKNNGLGSTYNLGIKYIIG